MNPDIPSCSKDIRYNTSPNQTMLKYVLICLGTLVVLTVLKFIEDSPVRSWKTVFFAGIPLAAVICFYVHWAFPPPPPPTPEKKKIANYASQMEQYFRHLPGVTSATVNGSRIDIDFGSEITTTELRNRVLGTGMVAANFMKPSGTNLTVTIHVTCLKRDRLEIKYDTSRGVVKEEVFD